MEFILKKLDITYNPIQGNAPLSVAWNNFCEAENAIAQRLYRLGLFKHMLTHGPNAWLLRERGDSWVLCHADWDGKKLSNVESRDDIGLDWFDQDENDIETQTAILDTMRTAFSKHLSEVSPSMEPDSEEQAQ